jgi:hypothetical protein
MGALSHRKASGAAYERVKSVSASVSALVMKLLAKTPAERYQTASGVESNLRGCLAEREANGCIADFSLGQHDASDRLRRPDRVAWGPDLGGRQWRS